MQILQISKNLEKQNKNKYIKCCSIGSSLILFLILFILFQFDKMNPFLLKPKLQKAKEKIQQYFSDLYQSQSKDTYNKIFHQIEQQFWESQLKSQNTQKHIFQQFIFMEMQNIQFSQAELHAYQKKLQPFRYFLKTYYNQKTEFILKKGHISQMDQNIKDKIVSLLNKGQAEYLAQIFQNMQKLNYGYQCHFSKKQCSQTKIFIFKSLAFDTKQSQNNRLYYKFKNSFLIIIKNQKISQLNQNQFNQKYLQSTQEKVNQQFFSFIQEKSNEQENNLNQNINLMQEVVLQKLQLSSLIKLCLQKSFTQQQSYTYLIQIFIYLKKLSFLQKLDSTLNYLNKTVSVQAKYSIQNPFQFLSQLFLYQLTDTQYQFINSKLDQLLTAVELYNETSYTLAKQLEQFVSDIRQSNISFFPSDYKLGVFLPVFIIIFYPLLYYTKTQISLYFFN